MSGGHGPAFEAVCDPLAERLAAKRAAAVGAGHSTPYTGPAFNDRLERVVPAAVAAGG